MYGIIHHPFITQPQQIQYQLYEFLAITPAAYTDSWSFIDGNTSFKYLIILRLFAGVKSLGEDGCSCLKNE